MKVSRPDYCRAITTSFVSSDDQRKRIRRFNKRLKEEKQSMQPQHKALSGSYKVTLIVGIIACILCPVVILMEIFDIFHPIDIVPITPAIHFGRLIFLILSFISVCVILRYSIRFERAKALGIALDFPRWFLFLNQWPLQKWTLKIPISIFILFFSGSVIFQILFPATKSFDVAWVVSVASFYASIMTFSVWMGHRLMRAL